MPLESSKKSSYVLLDASPLEDSEPAKPTASSNFRLLYSIFIANLAPLLIAFAFVFSSPLLDEIIRSADEDPWREGLDHCAYQNLIAPMFLLGSILGGLLSLWLLRVGGPRVTFVGALIVFAAGWVTIGGSRVATPAPALFRACLLGGRLTTGIAEGLLHASWTVYAGEIAPDKYRAVVMALGYLNYTLGTIAVYILGNYFSYWECAVGYAVACAVVVPFAAAMKKSSRRATQKTDSKSKCWESFVKLPSVVKGCFAQRDSCSLEFGKIRSFANRLVMMETILFFYVFMGYSAIVQYVGPILNVAGAQDWNVPHGLLIAATVGGGDLIGSLLSIVSSVKMGRIQSLCIGAVGICIGHAGIACYFHLVGELDHTVAGPASDVLTSAVLNATNQTEPAGLVCFFQPAIQSDVGLLYSPIALVSLAVTMVMYGTFWMMQPFVIVVELFPDDWRDTAAAIFTMSSYTQYLAVAFVFQFMESSLGLVSTFGTLSAVAFCGAVVIPCLIPETKGKTMGEEGDRFTPRSNCVEFWAPLRRVFAKLSAVCSRVSS